MITNTYPTKDCWDYLHQTQETVNFKIHVIDGKLIKSKLLAFPDLIIKYFADDTIIWVKNLVKQWLFQGALPEIKALSKIATRIDPQKLSKEELVFLMMAYQQTNYEDDWLPDNVEPFDFDFLWPIIASCKNEHYPINLDDVFLSRSQGWFNLSSMSSTIEELDQYAFAMQHDDPNLGNIQITLNRNQRHFSVKIACGDLK